MMINIGALVGQIGMVYAENEVGFYLAFTCTVLLPLHPIRHGKIEFATDIFAIYSTNARSHALSDRSLGWILSIRQDSSERIRSWEIFQAFPIRCARPMVLPEAHDCSRLLGERQAVEDCGGDASVVDDF